MDSGISQIATVRHLLDAVAASQLEKMALTAPQRRPMSYGKLVEQVDCTCRTLKALGVAQADKVAIVLPNGPEMAAAFLGVSSCAVAAPLNPDYRAAEFQFYLEDLGACAVIVQKGVESPVRDVARALRIKIVELLVEDESEAGTLKWDRPVATAALPSLENPMPSPDDVALILHTSGTTSRPKQVPLTHRNLCASAEHIMQTLALSPSDLCLNVMPLFHIHGLVAALLASMRAGAGVVCTPGFVAPRFFEWLDAFRPSWYTAVPTMHQAILGRAEANVDIIRRNPLRFIRSSSSALPPTVLAELEKAFAAPVIEAYGMTEAAHQMASNPLGSGPRKPGSVGRAAGPEVAIMDADGRLLPARSTGEIVIRGPNVTAGYVGNPEANKTAFTEGWFRTGDQGHMDEDGYLFITGRLKEIINRGGEKIAPREVDEALLAHSAVAQAVTFAMPDAKLGEEVAAAIVLRSGGSASEAELQEFVAARLASCKVPRRILLLSEIPKGPTGKVQRIGLAEKLGLGKETETKDHPQGASSPTERAWTPTGEKLAAIWREVLRIESVTPEDHFFELGGDSILAGQVISRIQETFQIQLSFPTFFNHARLTDMAERVDQSMAKATTPVQQPIKILDRSQPLPLSPAQMRMWLLDKLEDQTPAYNRPAAIRITGPLDQDALKRGLRALVRRHETLRMSFCTVVGEPACVVSDQSEVSTEFVDLSSTEAKVRWSELDQLLASEAQRRMDLLKNGFDGATLFRLDPEVHVLLLRIHHIVFDGWSADILKRDLAALCGGASLPELPVQYADFAAWQLDTLQSPPMREGIAWWKQHLAGELPLLELPTDYPRPLESTGRGGRYRCTIGVPLTEQARQLARNEGATLFMALLTAFKVLLHRYTSQNDLVVGCHISGRNRRELEPLIGVFINTLPLHARIEGSLPFRELLCTVRETCLQAYLHQEVPVESIIDAVQPERSTNRNPLFQVGFQLRNMPQGAVTQGANTWEDYAFHSGLARLELSLDVIETAGGLRCVFEFDADLFEEATIERMARHYETLLESICADPGRPIRTLRLLSDSELTVILHAWQGPQMAFNLSARIHDAFEEQARVNPDRIALEHDGAQMTYGALNRHANHVASRLRDAGIAPGSSVAICIERSFDSVIAVLAVLKHGCAFVPLEPTHPRERMAYVLKESAAQAVLTTQSHQGQLPPLDVPVIELDGAPSGEVESQNPESRAACSDVASIYFTSGSTGKPKGVPQQHRGILNTLNGVKQQFGINENDVVVSVGSLTFDVELANIFMPLSVGAKLVLATREEAWDGNLLIRLLESTGATLMQPTPSTWRLLLGAGWRGNPRLRIVSTGEALPSALASQLMLRGAGVWNLYGPTETTIWAVGCQIESAQEPVPIGKPLPNVRIRILDSNHQLVPIGVAGEICIGGEGVVPGYLNLPELTAERFVQDPGSEEVAERIYRTGDRGRWKPDGSIEFLGRMDRQLKVRGFRIEPAEIEATLCMHPHVRNAVVTTRDQGAGVPALVAYVEREAGTTCEAPSLREHLRELLPDYMVPANIVVMDAFPLTASGKVDLQRMPDPGIAVAPDTADRAPRSELERQLVAIWSRHLRVHPVCVSDDFFALGGNSLLAVQMFHDISEMLERHVGASILFRAPTIERLAAVLGVTADPASRECLIAVQPEGNLAPFFCVPGAGVEPLCFRELAGHLGTGQPFYGFSESGIRNEPEFNGSIEKIAARYVSELRSAFPGGSYRLGGLSFGGWIAWEMACQLHEQGYKIERLVLIDTQGPNLRNDIGTPAGPVEEFTRAAYMLAQKARLHGMVVANLSPSAGWEYLADRTSHRTRLIQARLRRLRDSGKQQSAEAYQRYDAMRNNYVARQFPGRATLIRGSIQFTVEATRDLELGWHGMAAEGLDVIELKGFHQLLLGEPFVASTADALRKVLQGGVSSAE